jgi:hypothetical protein
MTRGLETELKPFFTILGTSQRALEIGRVNNLTLQVNKSCFVTKDTVTSASLQQNKLQGLSAAATTMSFVF